MTLSLIHLIFLGISAIYVACTYSGCIGSAIIVVTSAVIAESLPLWLRRSLVPEALIVCATCVCWLWVISPNDSNAQHGVLGLVLLALVLIPARRGSLRWLTLLAACELVIATQRGQGLFALVYLLPISVVALAVDAWIVARKGARLSPRSRAAVGRSRLWWVLMPSVGITVLGLLLSTPLTERVVLIRERLTRPDIAVATIAESNAKDSLSIGLSRCLDVGGAPAPEPDTRIAARLLLGKTAAPPHMVYLRALALSDMQLDAGHVRWNPVSIDHVLAAPRPKKIEASWPWIYRAPGCGDVVLRPDGVEQIGLDGMMMDRDGNRYRSLLGDAPRTYQVSPEQDDVHMKALASEENRNRVVPRALAELPWEQCIQSEWAALSGVQAAEHITRVLSKRCRYDVAHIPASPAVGGGALEQFIFGTEEQRLGHCQYFATAEVVMLRRLGHQARCVAGFASNEYDEQGVVFRALHAHAWVEVVDQNGHWCRVDPTPASDRAQLLDTLKLNDEATQGALREKEVAELPLPIALESADEAFNISSDILRVIVGVFLCVTVIALAISLIKRPKQTPRQATLQRHTDELMRVARELGIPVRSSWTLTRVCAALTARTGIALEHYLVEHLSARYDHGAMPEAWPVSQLRNAGKSKIKIRKDN